MRSYAQNADACAGRSVPSVRVEPIRTTYEVTDGEVGVALDQVAHRFDFAGVRRAQDRPQALLRRWQRMKRKRRSGNVQNSVSGEGNVRRRKS